MPGRRQRRCRNETRNAPHPCIAANAGKDRVRAAGKTFEAPRWSRRAKKRNAMRSGDHLTTQTSYSLKRKKWF